ncbi:YrzA family protein [Paenibacillus alkaliterrae]|uniref:YrzA family protein n=1 Tax=Paenibacillus alkaliterrae TaxID=320909 RepID=UPI001F1AAB0A|nr:YrzA family protein [Paenibacillus alkaliterrae]MCF2939362.1 YrzA family protein [Paenibacillus alkaliterrae]
MDFRLDLIETKIEFFEAYDLKTLELKIDQQIESNKALLLDVFSINHQVVFNPKTEKMHYSAVVHFKAKR